MFEGLDLGEFWEDSEYARERYVEQPLTAVLVRSVEDELGFRLPAAYVALMHTQNGGFPKNTCFPTHTPTSWASDHIAITGFLGIGRQKTYSLLGGLGGVFMQQEWGYPDFGICICDCPSAGHDMVMLDYRECGPNGEPSVVHVDQEGDFRVTFLAEDFETFVRGLVSEDEYDTSEDDLREALRRIEHGSFSRGLAQLLADSKVPSGTESALRALLAVTASEKGYFALHADPQSQLVYDVLFDLFATINRLETPEAFLEVYPPLLAFGDGEITTGGYAPAFVIDWLKARRAGAQIVERQGRWLLSEEYQKDVRQRLGVVEGGRPA
jgi:hypothetical protein